MNVRMVSDPSLIYFLIGKDNYHDAREKDSACVSKNKRKALVGISIIAKTPLFMWDKWARVDKSGVDSWSNTFDQNEGRCFSNGHLYFKVFIVSF